MAKTIFAEDILDRYNGFCMKVIRSLNRIKRTVTFAYEVEAAKSIKHISQNSLKPSNKIPDYTRRARVLRDVKLRIP